MLLAVEILHLDLPLDPHPQQLGIDLVPVWHLIVRPHDLGQTCRHALLHPVRPRPGSHAQPRVRLGQHNGPAVAGENLVKDSLGDGSGVQRGRDESRLVDEALRQLRGREVGRDEDGAYGRRVEAVR